MEIATSPNDSIEHAITTPEVSFFVPYPIIDDVEKQVAKGFSRYPVDEPSRPIKYSGLKLERFVVYQGRFGSTDDTSLLEAIVQSAFDQFKSVRVVAEGSESVHSFIRALSEEFLNCEEAIHVERVTITSPHPGSYSCTVEGVYPAIPRFRHLAKVYVGTAESSRSVLEASLSAACSAVGQILLTFQPEGFEIPQPPSDESCQGCTEISPLPSTIDSPGHFERGSSLFHPVILPDDPPTSRRGMMGRFVKLFTCGGTR
jgi:hypothetical protein